MNETLKKVWTLIGYEAKSRVEEVHSKSNPQEKFQLTKWTLERNGKQISADHTSEYHAWLKAPSLETLMPKLVEAIVGSETDYLIGELSKLDGEWIIRVDDLDENLVCHAVSSVSLTHAVAEAFVQMCGKSLIDPKKVVLP